MRIILTLNLVLVLIVSFNCIHQNTPVDPGITDDEYQIYSTLLNGQVDYETKLKLQYDNYYLDDSTYTSTNVTLISNDSTDDRILYNRIFVPSDPEKIDSTSDPSPGPHTLFGDLKKTLPDVDWKYVKNNFDSVNQHKYPIRANYISLKKPFIVMSYTIYKYGLIYSSISMKSYIIRFTRAGFDPTRQFAIIGYNAGRNEGGWENGVKILKKSNSGWKVIRYNWPTLSGM